MPRVTKLEPSKRRKGWVDLHLDGAFQFRVPNPVARRARLTVGTALEPAEVEAVREASERSKAIERALSYLSYRPRSRFEVERHLRRKGYGESAASAALDHCADRGYLDDRAFAAAFARDRIRLKPRSPRMIAAELRKRGVSRSDARAGVEDALEQEAVTERELALRAAEARIRSLGSADPKTARRKLRGYLSRRGFRWEVARQAMEAVLGESGRRRPDRRPMHGA